MKRILKEQILSGTPVGEPREVTVPNLLRPLPQFLLSSSRPALSIDDRSATLTAEQKLRLHWACQIMESARLREGGAIQALMPAEAGDEGAVLALDLLYRLRNFSRSMEPGTLGGAVDLGRLGQTLSEDDIIPPDASKPAGRFVSVLLEAPGTSNRTFDEQRALVRSAGGDVASPIEQVLAVLVSKCMARSPRPFTAILRGSKRGMAILDTGLYGLRTVTDSGAAIRGLLMSMRCPADPGTRPPVSRPVHDIG